MIKKLIEKIYYKCYPDRINDYDKIPKNLVWSDNWNDIIHFTYEAVIPRKIYPIDDLNTFIAAAKRDALNEWCIKIRDNMLVVTDYDPLNQNYHIRVSLNIYKSKGEYRFHEDQETT